MTFLSTLLVATFLVATPAEKALPPKPSASAPSAKIIEFDLVRSFGSYNLLMNLDSLTISDIVTGPKVAVDVKISLFKAVPQQGFDRAPASFIYSVQVDCKLDNLIIFVSQAFDEKGLLIGTSIEPMVAANPKSNMSPITAVIDLICPPLKALPPPNRDDRYRLPGARGTFTTI